jgi:hypothetical protein
MQKSVNTLVVARKVLLLYFLFRSLHSTVRYELGGAHYVQHSRTNQSTACGASGCVRN